MAQNRLNLNFDLTTYEDRQKFIESYIQLPQFQIYPLTSQECEKIGDYLLWGKEPNGETAAKNASVEMESHWTSKPIESLESLLDSPGFNEQSIKPLDAPKLVIRKTTLSREQVRATAPDSLKSDFETLWEQIDRTEYTLNVYEFAHGKRTEPPRNELANRLSDEVKNQIKHSAPQLAPYHYLKLKRDLVALRQQQYELKDSYTTMILPSSNEIYSAPADSLTFGDEIRVLPMGVMGSGTNLIWDKELYPQKFTEEELSEISKLIWRESINSKELREGEYFDFCDTDHLYALCEIWKDVENEGNSDKTRIKDLCDTFKFYCDIANLSPLLRDLLDLKLMRKDNQKIREYINEKYSKSYNVNYISTLFCKKILGEIAAAAANHAEIVRNLFFEEEFKRCIDCGKWFLLRDTNFVHRKKSKDGFSPRCKACEKLLRDRSK